MLQESLVALKDCKRVVELKFQNSLCERGKLDNRIECVTRENRALAAQSAGLEQRVVALLAEKDEQTSILAEIQQSLVEKTSLYEAQIGSMQMELDQRVEEMNVTRAEDLDQLRDRYVDLFNEKAAELMVTREELTACQEALTCSERKIGDLEYRERELGDIINKLRENPDYKETSHRMDTFLKSSEILQNKLNTMRNEFLVKKDKETACLDRLSNELINMGDELAKKDELIALLKESVPPRPGEGPSTQMFSPSKENLTFASPPLVQESHSTTQARSRRRRKKKTLH